MKKTNECLEGVQKKLTEEREIMKSGHYKTLCILRQDDRTGL